MLFGRLAQLVEHPLDVREVTGSSPVSSTRSPRAIGFGAFVFGMKKITPHFNDFPSAS